MRGKIAHETILPHLLGSPPRMRGKVSSSSMEKPDSGITPAYAGKSEGCRWTWSCDGDHPRVCGEKFPVASRRKSVLGSPPHMRGKAECQDLREFQLGITPAYAGKSEGGQEHRSLDRDHPRVCGEKAILTAE